MPPLCRGCTPTRTEPVDPQGTRSTASSRSRTLTIGRWSRSGQRHRPADGTQTGPIEIVAAQNADRIGVVIGSGIGGINGIEQTHTILREKGPSRVTPFFVPMVIGNMASGFVSILLGARGPNAGTVTACATGTHSIGDAYRIIQRGEADAIIAGGTEAAITPLTLAGFAAARALSKRNDAPEIASRPFDQDR
ncbi:MAG TPA: hypothetical protein EYQ80_06915, partial [Candidatus Poseidoniales archaeon]|nr:hypothetical protein [Candidatus Poseidoniales archaeon]